ncbi:hypothetical protein DDB_G0289679 [Dictyostelium discoideum AX4]|uniref:Uncharacterized protein n=1 Tax=Dictyostelium discoideum TaxID=44689 RepID=Q54H66_DICDI|nr:hypothetical protein DDB_G0289679 [Dictyostelium discoideum AX4]EAL62551.1 hypothetical protein DDB_G0289679 [Dictyostelium discoideum AX4]|eukprot:XP_636052.1 hypothetical protein DDB_G0289679 [Dictyostelium discoideum AX4]
MSYTPNSFVGVLYGLSVLFGISHGVGKLNTFKSIAKEDLSKEIKTTATAEKSKAYQEGFEAGVKSTQPKAGGVTYGSEIEKLIAETCGTNLLQQN